MMNNSVKLCMGILCLLIFTSCGTELIYQEASQGVILTTDLAKSPAENLEQYFTSKNLSVPDYQIFNESGKTCMCTVSGGNCYCKLTNQSGGCDDVDSKCTSNKYIQITVDEGEITKYQAAGFILK